MAISEVLRSRTLSSESAFGLLPVLGLGNRTGSTYRARRHPKIYPCSVGNGRMRYKDNLGG